MENKFFLFTLVDFVLEELLYLGKQIGSHKHLGWGGGVENKFFLFTLVDFVLEELLYLGKQIGSHKHFCVCVGGGGGI